jgi:hypothetical protein
MTQTPDPNGMPGSNPTPAGPPPAPGPMGYQPPPEPGPMGYTPPPPPKKGNKIGLIILVVLGLLVVGGVAYALLTRDSSVGDATALQVGDCFDEPTEKDEIKEVQHQPCNTPHDAEVFLNFTSPAGNDEPYPVVSGFSEFVHENCLPAFNAYTGRDWQADTELDYGAFTPTLSGWTGDKHDRAFTCYVVRVDDGQLYGSVKNLGSAPFPTAKP